MKTRILTILLSITLINSFVDGFEQQISLNRLIRGTNAKKHQQSGQSECRYEKEAWDECDPTTGQQRRVLKLKASPRSVATNCEPEKYIQRTCKKNCRYSKGVWSECLNGSKNRIDSIKNGSTSGCESTRNITKSCKEQCNYEKTEWTSCENGIKTRTLTLQTESGLRSGCEPTKVIRKQCGHRQNRKERTKAKKNNVSNNTPNEEK